MWSWRALKVINWGSSTHEACPVFSDLSQYPRQMPGAPPHKFAPLSYGNVNRQTVFPLGTWPLRAKPALLILPGCRGCNLRVRISLGAEQETTLGFPSKMRFNKGVLCCAQSGPTLCDPHGLQPVRLLCPWDFPGKNTGVGCHFFSRGSSQPKDQTHTSSIGRWILYH